FAALIGFIREGITMASEADPLPGVERGDGHARGLLAGVGIRDGRRPLTAIACHVPTAELTLVPAGFTDVHGPFVFTSYGKVARLHIVGVAVERSFGPIKTAGRLVPLQACR